MFMFVLLLRPTVPVIELQGYIYIYIDIDIDIFICIV